MAQPTSGGGVVEEVPAPSVLYTATSLADQAISHDHSNRKKKRQTSPLFSPGSPWSLGKEEPDDSSSNDTNSIHLYDDEAGERESDLRGSPSKMEVFSEIGEGRILKCLKRWRAKRVLYFLPNSSSVFERCRTDCVGVEDNNLGEVPGPSNQALKDIKKLFAALRNKSALVDGSPSSVESSPSGEESASMRAGSNSVLTVVVPVRSEWNLPSKDTLLKKWRDAITQYCHTQPPEQLSPGRTFNDPHISVACGTLLQHPFFYEASSGGYSRDFKDRQGIRRVDKNEGFDLVIADIASCFELLDPCSGLSLLFDSLRQSVRAGGTLWVSGTIAKDLKGHDIAVGQLQRYCFEWMLEGGILTEKLRFQYVGSTLYAVLVATNPISVMIREAHALKHIKPNIDFVGFGCNRSKHDRFVEPFRKVLTRCGIQSADLFRDENGIKKLQQVPSSRSTLLVKPEEEELLTSLRMDTDRLQSVHFFDSLETSHAMASRTVMLAYLRAALPSFPDATFFCPRATIISGPFAVSETAEDWLRTAQVSLPAVVKPIASNVHEPFHVINEPSELTARSLQATNRTLPCPAIIQSLVEHKQTEQSGHHKVVWKIAVIRNRFCVALRASIDPNSDIYNDDKLSRVSKFPPTHTPVCPLDAETLNIFGRFTAALRKRLDLRLFNVDVIETPSISSQRCFSVVDMNYWPGFSETPNKLALLLDALCQRDLNPHSEAPLVPVCTPPTRAVWTCFRQPVPAVKETSAQAIKLLHIRNDTDLDHQKGSVGNSLPPLLEGREQDSTSPDESGVRSAASGSTGEQHQSPFSEDDAGGETQAIRQGTAERVSQDRRWISVATVVTVISLGYAVYRWIKSKK
eukprot:gb/GECG01014014.1/.p1 GENE.gb/GECG01014014.1/~~gb/GECG01014014.1/.p1  ORF type:complete len:858 (+),score=91.09 gb/GECG01014014.1/:1-2574(+)